MKDLASIRQENDAFAEGAVAARQGRSKEECPYPFPMGGRKREFWLKGFDKVKGETE